MEIFEKHIEMIKNLDGIFINPKNLIDEVSKVHKQKSFLLTIDDGYSSFYENAWPFLKKEKIPFLLFISTREVGKNGYMNWDQIREIENSDIGLIGNHSHTHEYLVDLDKKKIAEDINKSIEIFKKKLGYNPDYFSYPFGEYSLSFIKIIKKDFDLAFGQHSGVIDLSKNKFELPRFPINEEYGDLDRFNSLINLLPLQYKKVFPEEKLILNNNNPPKMYIEFFEDQDNLNLINCFSNESGEWKNTDLSLDKYKLSINFKEKFKFRRGRINCSMNDNEGWRWLGVQFSISEN